MSENEFIEVYGARVHNLKNIDVKIPRNKFVVITGLSGSGKSSLAFETIYAEGQRRYIETFGSYARQFLGGTERPDVDKITGLSPVISIEQKTVSKNPRSTVGTITEIYDFLRLLYARIGEAYSYKTGEKMVRYSEGQIRDKILEENDGEKMILLAPIVKGRKGHYRELFERLRKKGYSKVRVDGEILDLQEKIKLDRYKIHDIEIVVDRIHVKKENKTRISQSIFTTLKEGKGTLILLNHTTNQEQFFSRALMCPTSGIAYNDPEPNTFSFNSPYGACKSCNGLGQVSEADLSKIIPDDKLNLKQGAFLPLKEVKSKWFEEIIEALLVQKGFTSKTPLSEIDEEVISQVLYGTDELITVKPKFGKEYSTAFEGLVSFILRHFQENPSKSFKFWAQSFMNKVPCKSCNGSRLKKESLNFVVKDKNIADLAQMDIVDLGAWFKGIEKDLSKDQLKIGRDILKEIKSRINFLLDVGLDYLTLDRSAKTLSGGEAQRIRLATQIGSELTGVLYILDEPSIGLHQRDNDRLINSLQNLRDVGNTVLVVEHDKDMILGADYVIDIGPKAGIYGGEVIDANIPSKLSNNNSLTTQYLNESLKIEVPKSRRKGNGEFIELKGAEGNNLNKVNLKIPLGTFTVVTGVSGSGKSTLINETLYPAISQFLYKSAKRPLPFKSIKGLELVDKVIDIDQSPIGRTPRSNPATYTGMFTEIRALFANHPEAKIRGYKPGVFSFNVKGGRCEACKGAGVRTIEMNFLPDVYVECETCQGKRYLRETLEVRYKGKSINDVLNMTINQAVDFFESVPKIKDKVQTLQSVGLGYITLGQPSTTLSGGEAQRIKLATELSKRNTGKTFYILDEPTTGLHFEDIRMLLDVLQRLVVQGNTVLVIEHNMDIIKVADHIIDIGPEGGKKGGDILFSGTPEKLVKKKESITGKYLINELK